MPNRSMCSTFHLTVAIVPLLMYSVESVSALFRQKHTRTEQLSHKHDFRKDCGKPLHLNLVQDQLPGTGTSASDIDPYQVVLKDGYLHYGCLVDKLYETGDKFGNNKFNYKLGNTLNISIVHYADFAPPEDQKPMTHDVCFKFCRTIPGMNFFGIKGGRDCYCSPFFHDAAGDKTACDAECEGDPGSFCGGKTKSSVFSMHWCANTALELSSASKAADHLAKSAATLGMNADEVADNMQEAASDLQKSLSKLGDSAASELMQSALKWAGQIEKEANVALDSASSIKQSSGFAKDLIGEDFSHPKRASQAEELMGSLKESSSAVKTQLETLGSIFNETTRGLAEGSSNLDSYSPLAKYVDESHFSTFVQYMSPSYESYPSTCSGDWDGKPIFGVSRQDCAAACDKQVSSPACIGFSYYDESLCFLFSKFDTVTLYTGKCEEDDLAEVAAQKQKADAKAAAAAAKKQKAEAKAAAAAALKQKEDAKAAAAAAKKQEEDAKAAAAAAKKMEEQEKAAAAAAKKQEEEAKAAAAAAKKKEEEAKALAAAAKTKEEKKAAAAAAAAAEKRAEEAKAAAAAAKKKEEEAKAAAAAAAAAQKKEEEEKAAAAAAKKKQEEEMAAAAALKKKQEEELAAAAAAKKKAEEEKAAAAAAKKKAEEAEASAEEEDLDYDNMDFGDDADFADVDDCDEQEDTDCDGIMNEAETPESIAEDKKHDAALAKKEAADEKEAKKTCAKKCRHQKNKKRRRKCLKKCWPALRKKMCWKRARRICKRRKKNRKFRRRCWISRKRCRMIGKKKKKRCPKGRKGRKCRRRQKKKCPKGKKGRKCRKKGRRGRFFYLLSRRHSYETACFTKVPVFEGKAKIIKRCMQTVGLSGA